jgi:hypothetical protein
MSAIQGIRCRLGWHRYGRIEGDDRGAHQACEYSADAKQLDTHRPPEAHDHLGRRRARIPGVFEASATPPARDLGGVRRRQELGDTP